MNGTCAPIPHGKKESPTGVGEEIARGRWIAWATDSAEEAGKSNAHDCRVAPVLNLSSRERDPASIRMCRCSRRRSSHVQRCHTLLQDNYITKRVAF
ncbi:hypothetical protein GW17_00005987 [Ensete ventricosum]|nr:hypothetical protein GW17_00005987 [Ensete ventricosum]